MALIKSTKDDRPLYRVRWNYRTVDGRKLYDEKRFRSRKDAKLWERGVTAADTPSTERITVGQMIDHWLLRYVGSEHPTSDADAGSEHCEVRTQRDYRTQVDLRIRPFFGHMRCSKVTPATIVAWQKWMLSQYVMIPTGKRSKAGTPILTRRYTSATTANKSLRIFRASFRWGFREGLHTSTATTASRALKAPPGKPAKAYTQAEVARMMSGCELLRDATMIAVMAYAGLRWSECRGLRWSDIDWKASKIRLAESIDVNQTRKDTKSHARRDPRVLKPGMAALKAWRSVAPGVDLMFPNERGKPLDNWHTRNLPAIREASGIHFDPHELRDTYASVMIAVGASDAELTMTLGNRNVQLTRDRYADAFDARETDLAKRANRLLATL